MGLPQVCPDPGASRDVAEAQPDVAAAVRYTSIALILLLWILIYFASIFSPALLDDVDTIHAEAAREMVLRHDWVTLYTDGVRYLEKAPLMYWGVAASYEVFGISEWSTRLPLMLGVLAFVDLVTGLSLAGRGKPQEIVIEGADQAPRV